MTKGSAPHKQREPRNIQRGGKGMRSTIGVLSIAIVLSCFGNALASEGHRADESKGSITDRKGSAADEAIAETVTIGNTVCPVSSEDIEAMGGGIEYEHNGKIYNLCCASCVKVFMNDPEKYSAIAEESMEEEMEVSVEESAEGEEHTGSHHAH